MEAGSGPDSLARDVSDAAATMALAQPNSGLMMTDCLLVFPVDQSLSEHIVADLYPLILGRAREEVEVEDDRTVFFKDRFSE